MLIKMMIDVGAYVDSDRNVCWIPVDFVASGIALLSLQHQDQAVLPSENSSSSHVEVYHLCGDSPPLCRITDKLKQKLDLRRIPPCDWRTEMANLPASHRQAHLKSLYQQINFNSSPTPVPHKRTAALLKGLGLEWPTITDELIDLELQFVLASKVK